MSRDTLDIESMMELLTDRTKEIIFIEFLANHYSSSSQAQYLGAIKRLFYDTGKTDATELTYKDYSIHVGDLTSSKSKYIDSFFCYLYAYDRLANPAGFSDIWIQDKCIQIFERKKRNKFTKKPVSSKKHDEPAIPLNKLLEIQTLLIQDVDDIDHLKYGLEWFLLFETDCTVSEVRSFKAEMVSDGLYISDKGNEFEIPEKYLAYIEHLKKQDKSGLSELSTHIRTLGERVGMKNLVPKMITKAKEQNTIFCSNCGNGYSNAYDNWESVSFRIVCKPCAEELKKNGDFEVNAVSNMDVEMSLEYKIAPHSSSEIFYEIRKKIFKEVDYLKLHKYQMVIGELGEAFVYDLEFEKLKGTIYQNLIDKEKSRDNTNGYDILSYERDGTKLHIEVKTTAGIEKEFFITENELRTAETMKKHGKKYVIYRVENIFAENITDIRWELIEDISNNNKYMLKPYTYKVEKLND